MLLVEGDDDWRVIPWLIEPHGIAWGLRENPIVFIKSFDGIESLLKPGAIEMELKTSGLEALGIIVDANDSASERWRRIRERCIKAFPDLPEALPEMGLIVPNAEGLKLGVWLMPDNRLQGMLETYLALLIPDEAEPLWKYANEAVANAKKLGAAFSDVHEEKARIHTWLAWQDPPGRQLHDAVKFHILDPTSAASAPFVAWFRSFFGV
jgi:hypothetical protein